MTLSIIIVTYNVRLHVLLCLQSLSEALQGIESEIIVVDNQSTDDTLPSIRQFFPGVRLIENLQNEGFSKACNQGAAASRGAYLLFLNPDTILGSRTLVYAMEYLRTHPATGAAGIRMLNSQGEFLPESKRGIPTGWNTFCKMAGLTALFPSSRMFAGYQAGHLSERQEQQVEVLSGAFMLMPKPVFEKAGGFDERFFMYGEDIDLSVRIRQAGFVNVYLPDEPIMHFKGRSSGRNPRQVRRFYSAMLQYIDKYYNRYWQLPAKGIFKAAVLLRQSLALAGTRKFSSPAPEAATEFLYGDPASMEAYRKRSTRQEAASPDLADSIVLCPGMRFSFSDLIRFAEEHPGKTFRVYSKKFDAWVE